MIRIEFYGDRGAGKTVIARTIQQQLGSVGVTAVRETRRGTDFDVLHIDNDFNPEAFVNSLPTAGVSALIQRIGEWASDRNLIEGATSQAQTVKLFEEGGEVAAAVARGNRDALKDGIGDMIVVLTILAAQNGLTVEECVAAAYDEIKDRKGRMVDGVFIRDQ